MTDELRPPGESGDEGFLRHAGRLFLGNLYAALRSLKLYPVENAAVQRALDEPTPTPDMETALRDKVERLLREHAGNVSAVARALGNDRKQVRRWIKRFGLSSGDA